MKENKFRKGQIKMIKDYMKKQIVVQAMVWTGENSEELEDFIGHVCIGQDFYFDEDRNLFIVTLEGDHRADIGAYIIKGVKGEFYPCQPDIFEMSYEEVTQKQAIGYINDEWKRNRNFSTALDWLKQGAKTTRKEWKEMETYIYYDEKTGKTIYTNGLTETEWIPTSSDILENDWEIYEEE